MKIIQSQLFCVASKKLQKDIIEELTVADKEENIEELINENTKRDDGKTDP